MKQRHKLGKCILAFGLTAGFAIVSAGTVTVFQDDFGVGNGPDWVGRAPLVGGNWWRGSGTGGRIAGGVADTNIGSTGSTTIWGGFTQAVGPGQKIVLTYTTAATAGTFGTNGWSGIDLTSTSESEHRIFTGAAWGDWGTEALSHGSNRGTIFPVPRVPNSKVIVDVYFSYEYDTGNIEMRVTPQGGSPSTITASTKSWPNRGNIGMDKVAFNAIRINVGNGMDIALSKIRVDIDDPNLVETEWTGEGDDEHWSDAQNWDGGVPQTGYTLNFDVEAAGPMQNDLAEDTVFKAFDFRAEGGYYEIQGHRFGVSGGVKVGLFGLSVIGAEVVLQGDPVINVAGAGELSFDNMISGPSGLIKEGAGTLTFNHANTFDGPITVKKGAVDVFGDQTANTAGWMIGLGGGFTPELCEVYFNADAKILVASGKKIQLGNTGGGGLGRMLEVTGEVVNHGALTIGFDGVVSLWDTGNWTQNGALQFYGRWGNGAYLELHEGTRFTYQGTAPIEMTTGGNYRGRSMLNLDAGTFVTGRGFIKRMQDAWEYPLDKQQASIVRFFDGTLVLSDNIPVLNDDMVHVILEGDAHIDTNGFSTSFHTYPTILGVNEVGVEALGPLGPGSLVKQGEGTLTLTSEPNYTGDTVVEAGTLVLDKGGLDDGSEVVIGSGAQLALNFTGVDRVAKLVVNEVEYGAGIYGAAELPGILLGTGQLEVVPAAPHDFTSWAAAHGLSGDPEADFDRDGLSDAMEYALAGLDPTVPNGYPGRISGNTLSFAKNPEAVANGDLGYLLEISDDLVIWTSEIPAEILTDNDEEISVTIPETGSQPRLFVRLRVVIDVPQDQ